MSRERIDAVRRAIDAWNRGDVDGMLDHVAADAEYLVAEQNPNSRLLRGREEIAAYLRDWRETVSELRYEISELHESGDLVVLLGTMTGRPVGGGPEITVELAFVNRFDGDMLVRAEEYLDHRRALEAAGLR